MTGLEILSEHACFGGTQGFYRHASASCATPMRFGVFVPPQAKSRRVPVLLYLAGLTCTEETFAMKAGAQRVASELGLAIVTPDTSPREPVLPGDREHWDLGIGAGFYVDAARAPWSTHYRMHSYVTEELPALVAAHFPVDAARLGVFGHSMGGHGALAAALRRPDVFRSCSAFAPIGAPSRSPWGEKAFRAYLGDDREAWKAWDASELVLARPFPGTLLVDQGSSDPFLDGQLKPWLFEEACRAAGQPLALDRRDGYDHSYYFIASFVARHLAHHAAVLAA